MKLQDLNTDNKTKCLILGCGPSLNEITEEDVAKLAKDHLIITTKQSYLEFGEYSDIQCFNCNNIVEYERKKSQFVCCSPTVQSSRRWGKQEIDFFFHMSNSGRKLSQFKDLNEYFKRENLGKFYGPGIMFEIVMPLVYNLGINKIITVGWDYHQNEKEIVHFYKESDRSRYLNPANIPYEGENAESIENSKKINSFFKTKGVSLYCLDNQKCFLDKSIKRIKLTNAN